MTIMTIGAAIHAEVPTGHVFCLLACHVMPHVMSWMAFICMAVRWGWVMVPVWMM